MTTLPRNCVSMKTTHYRGGGWVVVVVELCSFVVSVVGTRNLGQVALAGLGACSDWQRRGRCSDVPKKVLESSSC